MCLALEIRLKLTDKELVESARNGDTDSFRILYERHWAMAVSLACSRLRDRHLAEDVAQDSFVVACRQLPTLKDGDRFPQWLGTIVRRVASSAQTSNQKSVELLSEPATENKDACIHDELRSAIGQLSTAQQEVVYLRYFGDLSYEEIAKATATTTGSVHGLLQRARIKLAKDLGKLSNR